MKKINVYDLTGKYAMSMKQGNILFKEIEDACEKDDIILDFSNVEVIASPFFNASICLLLQEYEIQEILSSINIENISTDGRNILNLCINNAIEHYKK